MLAAVFQQPGRMEVMEVDTPDTGVDEVLVKVGANTICGTDVRIFRGEKTKGIPLPTILGHEMAGKGMPFVFSPRKIRTSVPHIVFAPTLTRTSSAPIVGISTSITSI